MTLALRPCANKRAHKPHTYWMNTDPGNYHPHLRPYQCQCPGREKKVKPMPLDPDRTISEYDPITQDLREAVGRAIDALDDANVRLSRDEAIEVVLAEIRDVANRRWF